ncbi:AAA family ATPase [Thalassospira permensis]|uniref:Protein CR006 P-loop domain-containing protein n=1 Tax=Thalassospira permensis NBRC 106175 TaxID=1353532 RepID=A0ABR4TNU1_9PROT|nr:AAA family ATPase [Thalassospira permensis]KEO57078.1 hypothetical protein SMB34_17415 [Thalassospira permensis NBRC 106175]
MNSQPRPKFAIEANFLGPVLSLNGELSDRPQNLVFARNGTGKSFLSRALRYLDKAAEGKDISDAAVNLVSDEALDGIGSFKIAQGQETLGQLKLYKKENNIVPDTSKRIFHVFSEDFVHEELRERLYNPDGNIENQIAVDSDEIKLSAAKKAVESATKEEDQAWAALRKYFETEKIAEVHEKAAVSKQLKDYKELSFDALITKFPEKPDVPDPSFSDILKDLDALKSIPAEPIYPSQENPIKLEEIDVEAIELSLRKVTSSSTVSEDIKKKIEEHRGFFEAGVSLVTKHDLDACPFCEQNIKSPPTASTIQAYILYFQDEEARHKRELRQHLEILTNKEKEIIGLSPRIANQITRFDVLKRLLPSQKDIQLAACEDEIVEVCAAIAAIKDAIKLKENSLGEIISFPDGDLSNAISKFTKLNEENSIKIASLRSAIDKSDEERKKLQRQACAVFSSNFIRDHWGDVENAKKLQAAKQEKILELAIQEKASPKTDAKERVCDTFEYLLRQFFAEKYVFDRASFVLKRGENDMARGPHRTLSDGEKTAIAFCYFVASIHKKVKSNSEYQKVFLVFDDPVTSMSYDFIFTITQTLKNLSISNQGDISTNPKLIDGNLYSRPELIILTHSSYFFNISRSNRVVKEHAAFALHADSSTHHLTRLNSYVAPFQQQLKDVYDVVENGKQPDHQIGNAVRSVLEAVGRFCRPDHDSLSDFVTFLAGEEGLEIKSVMINNLSHGTYYDEAPTPEDLKTACEDTIQVVKRFAVGQLEILKAS